VRSEIRSGAFTPPNASAPVVTADPSAWTVADVMAAYIEQHVKASSRLSARQMMLWALTTLRQTLVPAAHGTMIRFEQKPIKDVTRADVEAIRSARRAQANTANRKGGEVSINRLLERLRHLFSWSVLEGYMDATPFRKGGIAAIKLTKEQPRSRRLLDADEETRLLANARTASQSGHYCGDCDGLSDWRVAPAAMAGCADSHECARAHPAVSHPHR
jgi:hypothetical protein